MSGQLGDLVVSLRADIARFSEDMGKATKISRETAENMSKSFGSLQDVVGGIGKAFGIATAALAGGAMFKDMISTTKGVSAEIIKLKNSMGVSAEEASVMRVALDDVFLSADDMAGAASRITKQLSKNEEAFKKLGVATRDSNGDFRTTMGIMTDTNSKLMEFREGTDRNVEGVKIYGKGWDEARKVLKLTSEAMEEGGKRAKELHLIMGESGLKTIKDYKSAMKDIEDVTESMKVQIGVLLMPELTKMAVTMGDAGVSAANALKISLEGVIVTIKTLKDNTDVIVMFGAALAAPTIVTGITALATALMGVSTSIGAINAAMLANPVGLAALLGAGTYYAAKQFDKGVYNGIGIDISGMNASNASIGFAKNTTDKNNVEIAKKLKDIGVASWKEFEDYQRKGLIIFNEVTGKWEKHLKASTGGVKTKSDNTEIGNKYKEYSDAFDERMLAQKKTAIEFDQAMNKSAYAAGLTDLDTYLNEKSRLTKESLQADVSAKQTELAAAQKAVKDAQSAAVYDSNGNRNTDKEEANVWGAKAKQEKAQQNYIEALAKQKLGIEELKDADRESIYSTIRGYQEQQAALADMTGDAIKAAKIRKGLEETSHARKQLEENAARGDIEAQKTLNDLREKDLLTITNISNQRIQDTLNAQLALSQLNGEYAKSYQLEMKLLDLEAERAVLAGRNYELPLIQAKQEELKLGQTDPLAKGWKDTVKGWSDTAKQLQEVSAATAQAMQTSFNDLFFDAMQGKLKNFADYFQAFAATIQQAVAKMLSESLVSNGSSWIKAGIGMLGGILGSSSSAPSGSYGSLSGGSSGIPASVGGYQGWTAPEFKSYAVGTNYVPYDMLAQIHKGEAIIPAAVNKQMQGSAGSALSISVPISIANGGAALASDLRSAIESTVIQVLRKHS